MWDRIKGIAKSIVFLIILISVLYYINQVLQPKYIYGNSTWPTTSTYNQFYQMENDSIDVLFLGSSVCVNAFSPQEIYNNCGIRSYNLGSEQQSIFLSYFWLKEALRFQSPQVVVLDTKFLFELHPEDAINATEGLTRKCLDPMKWSDVKVEAINELCSIDKSQSKLSYYLTNIRFHSRWSSLEEYDIDMSEVQYAELKGYSATTDYGPESYSTFDSSSPTQYDDFAPPISYLMMEYLNRMVELCKENDIKLVLVSLPGVEMNDGIHNNLTKYASDKNVDYYNLCQTDYYEAIGAVLPEESVIGHENLWGSIKMSKYIGNLLSESYDVAAVQDAQWEKTKDYYEHMIKNCELIYISDFTEYLKAISDQNYSIFISARQSAIPEPTDEIKEALKELGVKTELGEKDYWSYYAVIFPGEDVIEEINEGGFTITGGFRDNRSVYTITGKGDYVGSDPPEVTITIDGSKYSKKGRGFDIIVYDNATMSIIDSVQFNIADTKVIANR